MDSSSDERRTKALADPESLGGELRAPEAERPGRPASGGTGRPTVGSLFSGIGGMDLGLERAGFRVSWQVEWDAWCQRVLAKHWPDVPRVGDIHDAHAAGSCPVADASGGESRRVLVYGLEADPGASCPNCLPPVDLLVGGFPCQPFSNAGKRRGKADNRWLWPEFARLVGELRPRLVLVENVPGLLAGHGGMGSVLGDLATLGYDAEWDSIPAAAVGAPHLRYRVWIVAYSDAGRRDGWPGEFWPSRRAEPSDGGLENPNGSAVQPRRRGRGTAQASQPLGDTPSGHPSNPHDLRPWSIEPGGTSRGSGRWWWSVEPNVGRVAHGVPSRVDRLRGLGNAVVPQVVEVIGRQLIAALENVA